MKRYLTDEMHRSTNTIRGWLEKSRVAHAILKILAVFGVSLIMADGVLTPAQSVLGAIQGQHWHGHQEMSAALIQHNRS